MRDRILDVLAAAMVWLAVPALIVGYVVVWELAGTVAAVATWLVIGGLAYAAARRYG